MKNAGLILFILSLLVSSAQAQSSFDFTCGDKQPKTEKDFKIWAEQEVAYLATKEEKKIFRSLVSDSEKITFINDFWAKRDTGNERKNQSKKEYCKRIRATDSFVSGIPGWKTDRGVVLILYGKPDKIEKGRKDYKNLRNVPFEKWFYRNLRDGNEKKEYIFVDFSETNEFRLINSDRKTLLKHSVYFSF